MSKAISNEETSLRKKAGGGKLKTNSGGRTRKKVEEAGIKGNLNSHFLKNQATRELSYKEIQPLLGFLGYNQKEAADFLEVDPGTISRWKKGTIRIGQLRTKNLLDVDGIIANGVRIFGSEENFRKWLSTSNNSLGDVPPVELLKNPYGVEQVKEAVDALSWGNYL